jgi:hypothetical protein
VGSSDLRRALSTTNCRLIRNHGTHGRREISLKDGIQRVSQLRKTVALTYRIYHLLLRVRFREIRKYARKGGYVTQGGVKSGKVEFKVERPCVVMGGR